MYLKKPRVCVFVLQLLNWGLVRDTRQKWFVVVCANLSNEEYENKIKNTPQTKLCPRGVWFFVPSFISLTDYPGRSPPTSRVWPRCCPCLYPLTTSQPIPFRYYRCSNRLWVRVAIRVNRNSHPFGNKNLSCVDRVFQFYAFVLLK